MHSVYRFYSSDNTLLYVGCSVNPKARRLQHSGKPWYDQIERMETEGFANRRAAEIAERKAIRHEGPMYNVNRYRKKPEPPLTDSGAEQLGPCGDASLRIRHWSRILGECQRLGVALDSTNWKSEMQVKGYPGFLIDKPEVIAEMNAADPKAPKVQTPQSFYNWRANEYEGFAIDTPLDDVEIDEEEN